MAVSSTLYLGLKGVDITLTLVMRVKGGGMLGQEGGAKVYHQRFLASVNVRASCSAVVSQRQASYRLVSG